MNHDIEHWRNVLDSELWELKQEKEEILPALRLSYIYLPFRLKRCFSLCAMYPKDHVFQMEVAVHIWCAQGFVEPQGQIPLSDIARSYFQELIDRSLFQEAEGAPDAYVIHDLIHDMLQLVSANESFVVRNEYDLLNVPQNVRHLSLFTEENFDSKRFMILSQHKKLRTIFIKESLNQTALIPVIDCWSSALKYLRFLSCGFNAIKVLPETVARFKLLRCLKFGSSRTCTFHTFPESYCCLYNLQTFVGLGFIFQNLPRNFTRLVNLQHFRINTLTHQRHCTLYSVPSEFAHIRLLRYMNLKGELNLEGMSYLQPNDVQQLEMSKRKDIRKLILAFDQGRGTSDSDMEVLEALCPHPDVIQCLDIKYFKGDLNPTWFKPSNLQSLMQLQFITCDIRTVSWGGDHAGTMFSALTFLNISMCSRLSSLEQLLQAPGLPAIRIISIDRCPELVNLFVETFKAFECLETLSIWSCPKINWEMLVGLPPSLQYLNMIDFGQFSDHFLSCLEHLASLLKLNLSSESLTSIPIQQWSSLLRLDVWNCSKLTTVDFTPRSLPAVKVITIRNCEALLSLPGETFVEFCCLEELMIRECPNIEWRGLTFPISLRELYLNDCGDISPWVPNSLEHLNHLTHLALMNLKYIKSISAQIWAQSLSKLEFLQICECPHLQAIGGPKGIAGITNAFVESCDKLKGIKQPFRRGRMAHFGHF